MTTATIPVIPLAAIPAWELLGDFWTGHFQSRVLILETLKPAPLAYGSLRRPEDEVHADAAKYRDPGHIMAVYDHTGTPVAAYHMGEKIA